MEVSFSNEILVSIVLAIENQEFSKKYTYKFLDKTCNFYDFQSGALLAFEPVT